MIAQYMLTWWYKIFFEKPYEHTLIDDDVLYFYAHF